MKVFILSVAVLFFLQSASCDDVATSKKCEDFLPANVCQNLRDIAKKFNEKVDIVNKAVTDAYNHHKTRAVEVLNYVKEYLVARANNFKCEDYISPDNCAKITELGKKLHLTATQVSVALKEAIVNGATKAQDIFNKAVTYMRDRLSNLECKDVIGQAQCDQLKNVASLIKVKATEINRAIREAIIEGANKASDLYAKAMAFLETEAKCDAILGVQTCDKMRTAAKELGENIKVVHQAVVDALNKHLKNAGEILKSVQEYLVDKATNFKCTNVMSEDQCNKITEIGEKFKLKSNEILRSVKEAIVNSPAKAKEIYDRSIGFLIDAVKNFQCEDLLKSSTCTAIRENAKKFGAKASDITAAVKEAIVSGANTAKEYIQQATEYLKAKMSCDSVLSTETCDKIRSWADKFHVSLKEVDAMLRQAVSNGVTKVTDLYKAAIEYITDKWLNIFGDEPESDRMRRDLTVTKEQAKQYLKKLFETLKVKSEKVKAMITDLVTQSRMKLKDLIKKVKEYIAKYGKDGSTDAVSVYKRSLRDDLIETLKKVHGKTKELIEKILKLSAEQFAKIKDWIKEKLAKEGVTTRGDELDADLEQVQDMLEDATKEAFSTIVADAVDMAYQQ